MVETSQQPSFAFSSDAVTLNIGACRSRAVVGRSIGGAAGGACSFSTSRGKCLRKSPFRSGPFASISLALPFASATVAAAPAPSASPAKKKKSFGEIMEYAGKKALSGGIPGMVAMALQVLSLMWLR